MKHVSGWQSEQEWSTGFLAGRSTISSDVLGIV
jgi:hypothetical protein